MVYEKCGAPMKVIGTEKAYDELVYIPAEFFIRRHIVETAKCIECGKHEERDAANKNDIEKCNIVRAAVSDQLFPGSFCSKELLAHIIYEKYGKAVPLHRQQKDFESKNVPILKATMSNRVMNAAHAWCLPVVKRMTDILLAENIIHADETHMRRKFVNLIPGDKKLHKTSAAVKAVNCCDRIYHEEHLLEDCTAEERYVILRTN